TTIGGKVGWGKPWGCRRRRSQATVIRAPATTPCTATSAPRACTMILLIVRLARLTTPTVALQSLMAVPSLSNKAARRCPSRLGWLPDLLRFRLFRRPAHQDDGAGHG